MKFFNYKHKTIFVLSIILFALLINYQNFNLSNLNNNNNHKENDILKEVHNNNQLNVQELSSDNEYSGIGAAFNVTQWANRTAYDLQSGFNEGSYDIAEIPLENGWQGYALNTEIKDLYDTRNWCNGTFAFGSDNTYQEPDLPSPLIVNDSATIPRISNNKFQNWTFHAYDNTSVSGYPVTNPMSGNYINNGVRDYLELRMVANSRYVTDRYWDAYDENDRCMWNSSFFVDRGLVSNCTLELDVNPYYLADIDCFALVIYINNVKVYSKGSYNLELEAGDENRWLHIVWPQAKWQNKTNVFSDTLNQSNIKISVAFECSSANMIISHDETQIMYIDNVFLKIRSQVKPNQINLKLNSTNVLPTGWGKGELKYNANVKKWQSYNEYAKVNFSCTDSWSLGDFYVDLKMDYDFYAIKTAFETFFQIDPTIVGTKFSVENKSFVDWMWYVYIQVPTGYSEQNMTILFPKDLDITSVYASGEYSINVKEQCDVSTRGLININISEISSSPGGFWKFGGDSPNYCEDLTIYIRESENWIENKEIIAGDSINIRANISTSNSYVDIQTYITNTKAKLQIKFPDGSIWNSKTQIKSPNSNGFVNFTAINIPITGVEYIAGEYIAIVTWNNSYSSYGLNETGIITMRFTIKHDSILKPENDIYFIENILNTSIINIKVNFTDKIDHSAVIDGFIYALDNLENILNFDHTGEHSSIYLYELDASKFSTGNVSLRIFANSSYYVNKQINITVEIIEETILSVKNDFITDVQYYQNFTVQFNYTRKNNPSNLIRLTNLQNEFNSTWNGAYEVSENLDFTYNFTCNTSNYEPNKIHTFTFTVNVYKYEPQTIEIKVLIGELDSKIELYVNKTKFDPNDVYSAEAWQKINVTAIYKDVNDNIITEANAKISGTDGFETNLTFVSQYNHYTVLVNVSDLAEGIDYLDVYIESLNHKPSSIPFIVEITENKTFLEIYLNNINKTKDPSIEVSIGSVVNITVKYFTSTGSKILDALLELSRDYTANLTENKTLNQYQIVIDTKNLGVGVYVIRLTAEKNNFETQDEYLRIEVKKIRTRIEVDEDTIEIKPGENADLSVELINLESGAHISGMLVEYDWKLKDGEFDEESSGVYEATLKDVPEGSYTIIITVKDPSGQYEFAEIEVTVDASSKEKGSLLWQILLAIAIVAASALAGYIIYYQRVLKYPKPVRKVRKFRRTIKKKDDPKVAIISREEAFNQLFSNQKSSISKIKISEKATTSNTNKIKKESIKLEKDTTKVNEKSSNKPLINKSNEIQINKNKNFSKINNKKIEKNKIYEIQNESHLKLKRFMRKTIKQKNLKWNRGFKRIFLLSIILFSLLFGFIIFDSNNYISTENNDKNYYDTNINTNAVNQGLNATNTFSGIGSPWNVTYYANSTETKTASFSNNSFNVLNVQSASGWTGYKLNATVNNLYDSRQWINGTMQYGNGDGHDNSGENDSSDIKNWNFYARGNASDQLMSGNYINSTSAISDGHDCLEIRMNGRSTGGGRYSYDGGDRCGWIYTYTIPRGKVRNAKFSFDINPIYFAQALNSWAIKIAINDKEIIRTEILELKDFGEGNWGHIEFTQAGWINSNVFPTQIANTPTKVNITLAYTALGFSHGPEDGPHIDYQRILIDNVKLDVEAEAIPSQVNLMLNKTNQVLGNTYGKGTAEIGNGNWNSTVYPYVTANFSSQGSGLYGDYNLDFTTNLNLYVKKDTPETYYEPDTNSPGSYFSVENKSIVLWDAYGFINSPDKYEVTTMKVEFPLDYNIYWVSSLKLGGNVIDSCTSLYGAILIPTSKITKPSNPDGFWKIQTTSPNYCQQLSIYKNSTANPNGNDWNAATSFYSGDYINITGKISNPFIISNHISLTKAQLYIRFPNGSIWTDKSQSASVDSNGNFKFNSFRISPSPPNYQVGEYEAIITWNNSFSLRGLNETGVIYKRFTVIHDSVLQPEDGKYYIENIIDDGIININVIYKDREDNTLINNALVYAKNSTNHILDFSSAGEGIYRLEFDVRKAFAGNNTLRIFANSSLYKNKTINITIDVIKQTILTSSTNYISTPSDQNFSILFNYTIFNFPYNGINTTDISTNWNNYTIKRISEGYYNLTCNPHNYASNIIHTLFLNIRKEKYELQSTAVRVFVSELASSIQLIVNGTPFSPNSFYFTELFRQINLTVKYQDISGNHLPGANVTLLEHGILTEQSGLGQYYIIVNTTEFGEGIDTLTIFANKSQYDSKTINLNVDISQTKTIYQIYINNVNMTLDPTITVPITSQVSFKVKYADLNGNHIENATVSLKGQTTYLLDENEALEEFITTINTLQLSLGTKTLFLDAKKTNYEGVTKNVKINIRKIATEVTTTDDKSRFEIDPGEDFKIEIELKNLDFGGKVKDAEVSYSWDLEDGDLDETDDGIYEVTLEDVPEGTYEIDITVFKEGGLYEFEDYKITLIVKREEQQALLFLILFIVAVAVISALAGYFVAYYYVLKYPKPVRKVRKYRRTLKRAKTPKTDITEREKAFNSIYKDYFTKSTHLKKEKIVQEKLEPKIIEKTPLKQKLINKSKK